MVQRAGCSRKSSAERTTVTEKEYSHSHLCILLYLAKAVWCVENDFVTVTCREGNVKTPVS